jgi:hypothetical protein
MSVFIVRTRRARKALTISPKKVQSETKCWPEALSQIGISGLATRFYLGNHSLSHISYIQLGFRIFSLDELSFSSDELLSAQMGHPAPYKWICS